MKLLLLILLSIILYACAGPKYGCGTEHYRKPFTAYRIVDIDTLQNQFQVYLAPIYTIKQTTCICPSLPDSVKEGAIVNIPNNRPVWSLMH